MVKFLQNLCSEDGNLVYEVVYDEFKYILQLICLYPNMTTPTRRILSVLYFIMLATLWLYSMSMYAISAIVSRKTPTVLVQYLNFGLVYFIVILWLFNMNYYRKNLSRGFRTLAEGCYTYDEETEQWREKLKVKTEKKKRLLMKLIPGSYAFVGISTIVIGPVVDRLLGLRRTDTIYSKTGLSLNTPVPMWIFYGTDTLFKLIIASVAQYISAITVSVSAGTTPGLIFEQIEIVKFEVNYLTKSIELLPKRAERLYKQYNESGKFDIKKLKEDKLMQKCYKICLKQNAVHYQNIIRLFHDTQEMASAPMIIYYFASTVVVGMSASTILLVGGRLGAKFKAIVFFVSELLVVFLFSWSGEQLKQSCLNLRDSLYFSNWLYSDKTTAVTLQIMAARAQKPLMLIAGGLLPANFETFTNVINTAYTYFNLILAFKGD